MDTPATTTAVPPASAPGTGRARSVLLGMGAMMLVGSSVGVSRTLGHAPLFAAQGVRYTIALPILVTEGPAAGARLTAADWAAVGCLALMVTAVAFLLWYSSVAALGPGLAGLLAGIAPIAAALAGMLTGGAAPGPLVWLGILVVLAGLGTGLRTRPAPAAAPPTPPAPQEGDLLPCSATTTPSPSGSRPSARA
jgi:drug/metabolite transporter (DMT)-like permease